MSAVFFRIDGNHRLSASKSLEDPEIEKILTPFCIILFEETTSKIINPDGTKGILLNDNYGEKFEKVVFHNINTKSIPLTPEENLKVIIDDKKTSLMSS